MARLNLALFGGLQARPDAGPALALPTRKAQALLAYLALPVGQAHPRDKLAALLWGGIREESARASLRQALFAIRKALGEAEATTLHQAADTLALDPAAVDVDVAAFERAVREGTRESLERATVLYQGDLLAGLTIDEPAFEEWLLGERERLRELALEALAKLLAHQRKANDLEAAVGTGLRLLALDPLQEPVHRTLMRLYADLGRRGAALRQYQQCVTVFQRELGVEPEAGTKQLYQDILRQPAARAAMVEAATEVRGRAAASQTRGGGNETELIGRAAEMERLRNSLDGALGGAGRVITIIGEAGVGKSRLVAELTADAAGRGATILTGRAYESEQILPFGPWVDALRLGRIAEDRTLLERLGPARRELSRLLPEAGGDAPPPTGAIDFRPVFESVRQLIGHLAGRNPVVIFLEDLHWADEISARLLEYVGRRLGPWPVAIIATARDDELGDKPVLRQALDDLDRDRAVARLTLAPLSETDTQALVRSLARAGDTIGLQRLSAQVWASSEGNPFVIVESVRAYTEGTGLEQERGARLPERVREIVGQRLERLTDRAQSLSAVAAVIGREFDFALLHRAAGLDEEQMASGLEELVRRHIVHSVGDQFDFTHDRVRDVVVSRMLLPRRKLLHRRIAEAIETLYPADLRAHELALGQHYRAAEIWESAARHLGNAARAAWTRAANRQAVATFDVVLECLSHLPEDRSRSAQILDTLLDQELALMGLGDFRRSLEQLQEAEQRARRLGEPAKLARVLGRTAYQLGSIGNLQGALDSAEQARTIAMEAQDARVHASSNVYRARSLYALGDYRRTIEVVGENDRLFSQLTGPEAVNAAFWPIWGVLALAELGQFPEAISRGQEALRRARQDFGTHADVWAHLGVGRMYLVKGDLDTAIEILERGLPLCETEGDLAVYFSRMAASLGGAYALAGRLAEALPLLERADRHAGSMEFAYGHALVIATLGEARLLQGDVEDAARDADRALALTRRHAQRGWEAWTLRLHGETAVRRQATDSATTHFRDAIALAEERGMRPLLAHCRLGLGAAYRLAGNLDRARTEIAVALAEYNALEMSYWRQRADTGLAAFD